MTKRLFTVLLSLFPIVVFAQTNSGGSLSFAPPASDYSMVFLGNLFGVVDGVVHGSGSQIMGTIFSVFNSAVLALGGIIIMYTLLVSTMNTAHEGQMLGQKWSSIWIPLRSTFGLALLIPKASGYCLMQIFVMWVVVQGVGAADKVWQAALGYLNSGGVIIQAQPNPGTSLLATLDGSANAIPTGANAILSGQVCMLAIQKQLEMKRQNDTKPGGVCNQKDTNTSILCKGPVPDFLSTVNFVQAQQNNATLPQPAQQIEVKMPDFTHSTAGNKADYQNLDGVCGTIKWNVLSGGALNTKLDSSTVGQNFDVGGNITLTSSQLATVQLTRAIAIQQMYVDLASVAQVMISNNPQMNNSPSPNADFYAPFAKQQLGVPYTSAGAICSAYNQTCTTWGSVSGANTNGGPLFNGSEFMGAITDYNGIMKSTLNLMQQIQSNKNADNSRAFINQANEQGWMMAGAYFFDLVRLNGDSTSNSSLQDTDSGLDKSVTVIPSELTTSPSQRTEVQVLQRLLPLDTPALARIVSLINGSTVRTAPGQWPVNEGGLNAPTIKAQPDRAVTTGTQSASVYGFVNNSLMMQVPGQPGLKPMQFSNIISFTPDTKMYYLQQQYFSCGYVKTFVFSFCLGSLLGNIFYNGIIYVIYNALVFFFQQIIQQVVMAFIMIPIQGMSSIFKEGLETISKPGVNPIIALANMGVMYINFSGNLWMGLMAMAITSALIPMFGIFIFALFAFVLPLLFAWIGIMVSVGFTTAYYIPILPYMIFTFGSIAWLISVIEAMVAAPIVALGVTHPEGHDAFGKGEAAIMLLMNVFLRPAMMIIGYISGIALSYVSVWILNAGFDHAIGFIQGGNSRDIIQMGGTNTGFGFNSPASNGASFTGTPDGLSGSGSGGYKDWAGIFAYFFSILLYTTMYVTVVQKAFTLISYLPDKVLRWIGGSPDSLGAESAQWGDEMVKGKAGEAAKGSQDAQGQMGKQLGGYGQKAMGAIKGKGSKGTDSGNVSARGGKNESTPSMPIK